MLVTIVIITCIVAIVAIAAEEEHKSNVVAEQLKRQFHENASLSPAARLIAARERAGVHMDPPSSDTDAIDAWKD